MSAVLGDRIDDEHGRLGELRAADLVHADHHQIGIELGLRSEHDGCHRASGPARRR
jgi:hypothetical protein